ncbi:MAG: hypothetical protein Q9221_002322 [Calogaya cf. arnoldii]
MVHSSAFVDNQALFTAIDGLRRLSTRLAKNRAATVLLNELSDFAQSIQSYSATMQSEQVFAKLQPLRAWLFWTPITFLSTEGPTAVDLLLLAQLYSLALAVDASFPELRGAALGSLTTIQIEQIDHRLRYDSVSMQQPLAELDAATVEQAMHFPQSMATRHRLECTASPRGLPGQRISRGMQHLSIGSTPDTPNFLPGTPVGLPIGFGGPFPTMLNPSAEDLSIPASRYGTPSSRRASQLIEASPKLYDEGSYDGRSMTGYSFRDKSPAYSSSFHEDDHHTIIPGHSPAGYPGEKATVCQLKVAAVASSSSFRLVCTSGIEQNDDEVTK